MNEKIELLRLLEQKAELAEKLPHLHGWKFYPWARTFFESRHKMNFICAGNQVSKSSTQWRRAIELATNRSKWDMWRRRPRQFWYLYPTKDVATIETDKKVIPEFLPRDEYKDHPDYGWRLETKNKYAFALHFNTEVSIYYKSYAQDVGDLQSGSCDAIFFDEELPVEDGTDIWSELCMRLVSTDGFMHGVFTPTLNQEFWRCVMEEKGPREKLVDALKINVSMFDCLYYEDGTRSHWTEEQIQRAINACKSEAEVQRRVFGRFVTEEGIKYSGYNRAKHRKPAHLTPSTWLIYAGIDYGTGGGIGHPPAIVFVACDPTFRQFRVFKAWKGDDGSNYTAGDIFLKYIALRGDMSVTGAYYDHSAKDMAVIAERNGECLQKAEKGHDIGEEYVNVLFKNGAMYIYEGGPNGEELDKLSLELSTLRRDTPKTRAKDDLCDALRYALTNIPIDFTLIVKSEAIVQAERVETTEEKEIRERTEYYGDDGEEKAWTAEDECAAFQSNLDDHW